jgi:hypothetical protein
MATSYVQRMTLWLALRLRDCASPRAGHGSRAQWAVTVPGAEANFSLYHGAAGIVLALL